MLVMFTTSLTGRWGGPRYSKAADYAAFEKILAQASARFAMPVLSYAIMPNHWHLVVKPEHDGTLSKYLKWLTVTHVRKNGTPIITPRALARFTREDSSRFPSRKTTIS